MFMNKPVVLLLLLGSGSIVPALAQDTLKNYPQTIKTSGGYQ